MIGPGTQAVIVCTIGATDGYLVEQCQRLLGVLFCKGERRHVDCIVLLQVTARKWRRHVIHQAPGAGVIFTANQAGGRIQLQCLLFFAAGPGGRLQVELRSTRIVATGFQCKRLLLHRADPFRCARG